MLAKWPLTHKHIHLIAGHYGSGKTELAVSLALFAAKLRAYPRIALIDLDIANPYFRSRERRDLLEQAGVGVFGSAYREEITAELPALGASAPGPLEDPQCLCIVDLGGNGEGAKVIRQFGDYFHSDDHEALAVVNANRPDTATVEGACMHLADIEATMGFPLTGIVNNCHLLRETTPATIQKGHTLCLELERITGLPLMLDCYPAPLVDPDALTAAGLDPAKLMPLGMYMRETWLDR